MLLSLIVIQVEDFNEMFICRGCSNSKGKKGIRELVGRDQLWSLLSPALSCMGDLLMDTSPGQRLSRGKGFVWIACLISKENVEECRSCTRHRA